MSLLQRKSLPVNFIFYLSENSKLYAFGDNSSHNLGFEEEIVSSPKVLMKNPEIKIVSSGPTHTFVYVNNGNLFGFGLNLNGELGNGNAEAVKIPKLIRCDKSIKDIICGEDFSIFLSFNGDVFACGSNNYGQLGFPAEVDMSLTPKILMTDPTIKAIYNGYAHVFLYKENGDLFCWGANGYGQVGLDKNLRKQYTPHLLCNDKKIKKIACGFNHTLILNEEGEVQSYGSNNSGQCGIDPGTDIIYRPNVLMKDPTIISIFAGSRHSLIYKSNGDILLFGDNYHGQLGMDASVEYTHNLNLLMNEPDIKDIYLGDRSTYLIKGNGELIAFGSNDYHQLGYIGKEKQTNPTMSLIDPHLSLFGGGCRNVEWTVQCHNSFSPFFTEAVSCFVKCVKVLQNKGNIKVPKQLLFLIIKKMI